MIVLFEILTDFKHIDEILSSKERGFFFFLSIKSVPG